LQLIFYTFFLWLYKTAVRIVSPWNQKARLWLQGRKDIMRKISELQLPEGRPRIWMHCASLGEFEQGRPIIEQLRKNNPELVVVISFFSPSGYEIKKNYSGADLVLYLPEDSEKNARAFVDSIHPNLVLWIKYEYWYFYLRELKTRNIPVLLVSAIFTSDQPFFKWHGTLYRSMLTCFSKIFVQNEDSQKRMESLGLLSHTQVSGDTRFDRVVEIATSAESFPAIESFCGDSKVIVAGSTWEEDEEELDHYANTHAEIKFIIAPHEIDEDHLRDIEGLFHHCIRYSIWEIQMKGGTSGNGSGGKNVLLIDNIGMLSRLYRYATICYVGGGLGDDGVHNVLEAAVYGKPVVYGPVIEKYNEAVELSASGGGIVIESAIEAEQVFDRLLSDPTEYNNACQASRKYVYENKGATEKIVGYIYENRLLTN
jgi:3-deoxy-D-manno-octulosonic-acid transferase